MGVFQYLADRIALAYYLHELEGNDIFSQEIAARRLREISGDKPEIMDAIVTAMLGTLKCNDIPSQDIAARRLGEIAKEKPETIGVIVPAMLDTIAHRRRSTFSEDVERTLVDLGGPAIPPLTASLKDSDSLVRNAAAWAIKSIAYRDPENPFFEKAVRPIFDIVVKDDRSLNKPALEAIVSISRHAIPVLVEIANGRRGEEANLAAFLLGDIGERHPRAIMGALPAVMEAILGGNPEFAEASYATRKICHGLERLTWNPARLELLCELEAALKATAASMRASRMEKDALADVMLIFAKVMCTVAAKKNELARNAMQEGGLLLAGERPKPPKKDENKSYRALSGIRNAR